MSFLLPDTLTNDSPISQHRRFKLAFHGRFSPFDHFTVGSRPANLQMWPTVGAFVMSMFASRPELITGPMPQTFLAQTPIGWAPLHLSSTALICCSRVSRFVLSHSMKRLGSAPSSSLRCWLALEIR